MRQTFDFSVFGALQSCGRQCDNYNDNDNDNDNENDNDNDNDYRDSVLDLD